MKIEYNQKQLDILNDFPQIMDSLEKLEEALNAIEDMIKDTGSLVGKDIWINKNMDWLNLYNEEILRHGEVLDKNLKPLVGKIKRYINENITKPY